MGKVIYTCAVDGCENKKKVRVKGVEGVSTQFWLCREHNKEKKDGKRRKNKGYPPVFRRSRDYSSS